MQDRFRNQKILVRIFIFILPALFLKPAGGGSLQEPASQASAPSKPKPAFLPSDYLPLNLGNRWIYTRSESRLKKTDSVRIEIISTPIIKWKTYYVFNHLPFVPGLESANNILVRYDAERKRYLRKAQEGEVPLFPIGEDKDAKFDVSLGEKGQPVENRLSYLTCADCADNGMEMVFDRGIGVVAIESTHPWGSESYELKSAEVNHQHFGDPLPNEKVNLTPKSKSVSVSKADPNLDLKVEKKIQGAQFVLKIKNPTDSFLSFNFTTSQNYDFSVREKDTGFEIWRWSKGNYFAPVLRNIALQPQQEWIYEAFWDFKDNEGNDIKQGAYEVVGIFTTREPRQPEPVAISVP